MFELREHHFLVQFLHSQPNFWIHFSLCTCNESCTNMFRDWQNTKFQLLASIWLLLLMQNGPIETSKTILHRWMHPESGYTHFSTWRCKKQQECIQKCGLSYRPYRNKDSRIDVLTKLCAHELPVDAAAVERELERRQIDTSSARSAQQKAKLLLETMDGSVHLLRCFDPI